MLSWIERQGHGTQLNREAGSLYADKQGGGVYGIQQDLGDGLANHCSSSLYGGAVFRPWAWWKSYGGHFLQTLLALIFCPLRRALSFSSEPNLGGKILTLIHESEALGSVTWLCSRQHTHSLGTSLTQGFPCSLLPTECSKSIQSPAKFLTL